MNNKKGFTLVELLVTIVILGIITAMSIPLIGVIRDANTKRKYKTYLDSLVYNAKLYVDSYQDDLFKNQDSGCAYIYYDNLKDHFNIKDINIDDVTCDTSNTFVKVSKLFDNYNYYGILGCRNKKDHNNIFYPERREMDDTCGVDVRSIIGIDISPSYYEKKDKKKVNITVTLSSNTGIAPQSKILYGFYRDTVGNSSANEESTSSDYLRVTHWHDLTLDIPNQTTQLNQFKNGQTIVAKSKSLETPKDETGVYRLVLKIENLSDLAGADWKNGDEEIKDYVYSKKITGNNYKKGLYNIDNTKPTNVTLNLESSRTEYNSKDVYIRASGTDNNNLATDSEIIACYSVDSDACSKTVTGIKNYETGTNVSANKYYRFSSIKNLLISLCQLQDGSTHTVYLTVSDLAANYVTISKTYKVDHVYKVLYTMYNGSHGAKAPDFGVTGRSFEISNGYKTVTVRGNQNGSGATIGSSTSGTQAFDGWSSNGLGPHAKIGTNSNPTTTWTNGVKTTNNYFLDLTDGYEVTLIANWGGRAFSLPSTTRIGYTCGWWSLPGPSGGTYMGASRANWTPPYNSPTTVDAYSRCVPNPYKIRYNLNGATSISSAPTTATYDQDVYISNPSKTVTIVGNANGTRASIGPSVSTSQSFTGWTSSTIGGYARAGMSANPTGGWGGGATASTHFMNLTEIKDREVTMNANWGAKWSALPTISKRGYECSWMSSSTGGDIGGSGVPYLIPSNSSSTINVYAKCTPIVYSITYNYNGGNDAGNPSTYTVEDTFTLNNPTREGYTFTGWTGTELGGLTGSVTISNAIGNRSYTANWQVNSYPLRVVGKLDGSSSYSDSIYGYGHFSVWIEGSGIIASNVTSFSKDIPYQTRYEIIGVSQDPYHRYEGYEGSSPGYIPVGGTTVALKYETVNVILKYYSEGGTLYRGTRIYDNPYYSSVEVYKNANGGALPTCNYSSPCTVDFKKYYASISEQGLKDHYYNGSNACHGNFPVDYPNHMPTRYYCVNQACTSTTPDSGKVHEVSNPDTIGRTYREFAMNFSSDRNAVDKKLRNGEDVVVNLYAEYNTVSPEEYKTYCSVCKDHVHNGVKINENACS